MLDNLYTPIVVDVCRVHCTIRGEPSLLNHFLFFKRNTLTLCVCGQNLFHYFVYLIDFIADHRQLIVRINLNVSCLVSCNNEIFKKKPTTTKLITPSPSTSRYFDEKAFAKKPTTTNKNTARL